MAFTPTVVLSQASPAIMGQPCSMILTITNSGSTAANITSISVSPLQGAAPMQIVPPSMPVGSTIQVAETTSLSLPFSVVYFGQQLQGMPAPVAPVVDLVAVVYFDDASTKASGILSVQPNAPMDSVPVAGQARFDKGGSNVYEVAVVLDN